MIAFIDLDGTLLDSTKRHTVLLERLLEQNGITADISDYSEYKRVGKTTKQYLVEKQGLDTNKAIILANKWSENIENDDLLITDKWYDDSSEFLQNLKHLGYKRILLTARQNADYVMRLIQATKDIELDEICVVNPFYAQQEKQNVINKTTDRNRILIGDTETDYKAAKEASIESYILNRGFRNKIFWQKFGIQTFNNLYEIKYAIIQNSKNSN